MGRVSKAQAALNRQHIVETASRLFRQQGVEGVSIADIMGAAGLTPGGFYKHFASKEALVDEAFALAFQQALGAWDQVAQRERSGQDRALAALVRFYFRPRPAEWSCPMLAFATCDDGQAPQAPAMATYRQGAQTLLERFRTAAQKAPASAQGQALTNAEVDLLFAAMVGTGLLARSVGDASWIRELQAAVLAALPPTDRPVDPPA
ncbi:TetR family transcriptional regulator [Ideonella oryzae]|uniref:TetR/AcrR family transcriptional regulator n=1 Tax=Ideonella oryzae TaxID=2937441 RepID=A0ABT1BGF4_9BURK|nr:TetR family transcriptional regulator [Ideonella oryzae]MCO5975333.1 TetR/AcrR family transcriptional regulator [Ideonella oryzae]